MSSERFCANSGRTFGYISYAIKKLKNCNFWFLTCWLTKGQQVISSSFFFFFFLFPPFLSGGIANAKYQIQMNIAFIILCRTPSEHQTKVQTRTSNPNLDWTLTEPWPNLNWSSTKPQPNFDLTLTVPQPNLDGTSTKPRPNLDWTLTKPNVK